MRSSGFSVALLVVVGLSAVVAAPAAATQDGEAFRLLVGYYDIADSDYDVEELGVEGQLAARSFGFLPPALHMSPVFGVGVTSDSAVWGYAGFRWNLRFAGRWWLGMSTAFGLFDEGDGKELGGPVEFRSAIELGFELTPGHRLGVTLHHLSNAGIYDLNPGSNSLLLTYTRSLDPPSPAP